MIGFIFLYILFKIKTHTYFTSYETSKNTGKYKAQVCFSILIYYILREYFITPLSVYFLTLCAHFNYE